MRKVANAFLCISITCQNSASSFHTTNVSRINTKILQIHLHSYWWGVISFKTILLLLATSCRLAGIRCVEILQMWSVIWSTINRVYVDFASILQRKKTYKSSKLQIQSSSNGQPSRRTHCTIVHRWMPAGQNNKVH